MMDEQLAIMSKHHILVELAAPTNKLVSLAITIGNGNFEYRNIENVHFGYVRKKLQLVAYVLGVAYRMLIDKKKTCLKVQFWRCNAYL